MVDDRLLFSSGDLGDFLRGLEARVTGLLNAIPAERVSAIDPEDLIDKVLPQVSVEPLSMRWDAQTASMAEVQVDVSQDPRRLITDRSRPLYMTGTKYVVHVPFTGAAGLFDLRPSTHTLNPPRGVVRASELLLVTMTIERDDEGVRRRLDELRAQVRKWADWSSADVTEHNQRIRLLVEAAINARRERVIADREGLSALGLPANQLVVRSANTLTF